MKFRELHKLIHNLSDDEHMTVEENFQKGDSSYHQLYEFLRVLPLPYEEAQVALFCEEFEIDADSQRTYRNRLLKTIDAILLAKELENNAFHKLQEQITKAKIFFQRECYVQAEKELKKAAKMEKAIGHPASRREINSLLARKLYQDDVKKIDNDLDKYHHDIREAAADFQQQTTINLIYQDLFRFGMRQKDEETQDKWEVLTEELRQIPFPIRAGVENQIDYVTAWLRIAYRNEDLPSILKWAKRGLQIFVDKPAFCTEYPRSYVTVIDHYLSAVTQAENFDKSWELLALLKKVDGKEPLVAAKKEAALILYELTIYCYAPKYRQQLKLDQLEDIKIRFDKYKDGFLVSRKITINYMLAHLYTILQDYPNAESYIKQFNLHVTERRRTDVNRVVLLMRTLITVMDKRPDMYAYKAAQIKAAKNTLNNWGNVREYERTVLRNLKRIIDCPPSPRDLQEVLKKFRTEIKADNKTEYSNHQSGVLLFLQWLDGMLD